MSCYLAIFLYIVCNFLNLVSNSISLGLYLMEWWIVFFVCFIFMLLISLFSVNVKQPSHCSNSTLLVSFQHASPHTLERFPVKLETIREANNKTVHKMGQLPICHHPENLAESDRDTNGGFQIDCKFTNTEEKREINEVSL